MSIERQRRHQSLLRMGQVLAVALPLSCMALYVTADGSSSSESSNPSSPQITDGIRECSSFDNENGTIFSAATDLRNRGVQGSITIEGGTNRRYENWNKFYGDSDGLGIIAQGVMCGLRQPDWIDQLGKLLH